MKMFLLTLVCLCFFILSCTQPDRGKEDVEAAMQRYNLQIISMNLDSIASSFTEDGDLGDIAHGRDSIRKFLSKFSNYKVLLQESTTSSVIIRVDTAFQTGKYKQSVIVGPKDTAYVKGAYMAKWIWQKDAGWKIKLMKTNPL